MIIMWIREEQKHTPHTLLQLKVIYESKCKEIQGLIGCQTITMAEDFYPSVWAKEVSKCSWLWWDTEYSLLVFYVLIPNVFSLPPPYLSPAPSPSLSPFILLFLKAA